MRDVLLLLMLPVLLWVMPEPAGGGEIYQWRDAAGVVQYSDRAAPGARPVQLKPLTLVSAPPVTDRPDTAPVSRGKGKGGRGKSGSPAGCGRKGGSRPPECSR